MFERYSTALRQAIFIARYEASEAHSHEIAPEHLLLGLLRVDPVTFELLSVRVDLQDLRNYARSRHPDSEKLATSVSMPLGTGAKLILDRVPQIADVNQARSIRTEHLLLALLELPASHIAGIISVDNAKIRGLEALVKALPKSSAQPGLQDPNGAWGTDSEEQD